MAEEPVPVKVAEGGASAAAADSGEAAAAARQDPTITDEERAQMAEVLELVPPEDAEHLKDTVLGNPSRLVKFVRARKHSVKKTLEMLHQTAKFRRKRGNHDILTRFKPNKDFDTVLLRPVHYMRDRDGGLVLVHRTGLFSGAYFCKYYTDDYLIDLVTYGLELLTQDAMRHMEKTGAAPYISFVLDFSGYGSHVLGPMGITQTLINVFQNHFPETLKRAVIINAPWMFRAIWAVVQAFLDPVVKAKIKMLGSKGTLVAVQEFMDDDQIPAWMGGTFAHNGDEFSAEVIAQGGIPPKPDLPKGQTHIQ